MEPFVGEIKIFAGTYAPEGWFFCQGQTLPISRYQALFSLIGTYYGGDGAQTFNLPNLGGRAPIGTGASPGTSTYQLAQVGGTENVTITSQQMPAHIHSLQGVNAAANQFSPEGNYVSIHVDAVSGNPDNIYNDFSDKTQSLATLNASSVLPAGGNQPVNIQTPYLAMNYIIAWTGIYPPRP